MLFANAVNILCATLNIGCSNIIDKSAKFQRVNETVVRITSVVPIPNDWNVALSGSYSSASTQIQRKLKNPKNFGPNGVVDIGGFEFDEIDLGKLANDKFEGKRLLREKLSKTDILHLPCIMSTFFDAFKDDLLEFIQNEKLVVVISMMNLYQIPYMEALGYEIDYVSNTDDDMYTTVDFKDGPFGSVTTVDNVPGKIKIIESPPGANTILEAKNGETCGMEEKTKIVLGTVNWILDGIDMTNDTSCQTNSATTFACNVFAKLVDKALKLKQPKTRITSLVPFSDNRNEALAGQYSSGTLQLQRKLQNPENFGVNGIVPINGFEFSEINLEDIDNDDNGRKIVEKMLTQTDILYWSAISNNSYTKFYQQLIPYVQQRKVVLLMTLDYEWQNYYSKALGYTVQSTPTRELHPVVDFTGPFGSVSKIQTGKSVVKVVDQPQYAAPILEDDRGEVRGIEEDTKVVIGDSDWLLNTLINDDSDSCKTNDQVRFACNVFALLVKKIMPKH